MNTVQLECFLAVAEYLNFARASEQMNLSQPAVTHQIQGLENELGVKLFHRTTRSVEMTPAGLTFLDDAKQMVEISRRALHRFAEPEDSKVIGFSIGCTSHFQMELLMDVLKKLVVHCKGLHPNIQFVLGGQVGTRIEEGSLDVALSIRNSKEKRGSLRYLELQKIPLVCVAGKEHIFAEQREVSIEEVKKQKLILYHPRFAGPEIGEYQWMLSQGKSPADLFFCETTEAAMVLAGAGFGVAILPQNFVPEHQALNTYILRDVPAVSFGVYYQNSQNHPLLKEFLRLLRQFFAQNSSQKEE